MKFPTAKFITANLTWHEIPPPVSKNVEMQKKTTQPPNIAIFGVFWFKKPTAVSVSESPPRTPMSTFAQCTAHFEHYALHHHAHCTVDLLQAFPRYGR